MSCEAIRSAFAAGLILCSTVAFHQPAAAANGEGLRQHARICSPLTAVRKARAMGLRAPEVRDMSSRRVVVAGRGRHGPERIVFANVPGCPLLHR